VHNAAEHVLVSTKSMTARSCTFIVGINGIACTPAP